MTRAAGESPIPGGVATASAGTAMPKSVACSQAVPAAGWKRSGANITSTPRPAEASRACGSRQDAERRPEATSPRPSRTLVQASQGPSIPIIGGEITSQMPIPAMA